MRTQIAAVLILAVSTSMAFARKWTDSTGKYTVEAEFVELKDGKVRLRKGDDSVVTLPIERLSEADQEYVRTLEHEKTAVRRPGTSTGAGTSSADTTTVETKKSGNTPRGPTDSADQGVSKAAQSAVLKIWAEADVKRIKALSDFGAGQSVGVLTAATRPYIWRDGKFNQTTANPQTFNAAVAHISQASITTAQGLLLKEGDRPKVLAFVCLVGAASNFVPESGRMHTKAFDLALGNLSRANMEKARDLINDPEGSEPLFVLLRAAGYYVNDKGEFNAAAFNAGLQSVTPDDLARVRREASCAKSEDALDLLLRQKSIARTEGRDQPNKEAKGESAAQQPSKPNEGAFEPYELTVEEAKKYRTDQSQANLALTGNIFDNQTNTLLATDEQIKEIRAVGGKLDFTNPTDRGRYVRECVRILGDQGARKVGIIFCDQAGRAKYVWPKPDSTPIRAPEAPPRENRDSHSAKEIPAASAEDVGIISKVWNVVGPLLVLALFIGSLLLLWRLVRRVAKAMRGWAAAAEERRILALTATAADLKEDQPYDLIFLHQRGFVRVRGTGQSITEISGQVENLIKKRLHVVVKPGTYFVSSGSHQNMVTRTECTFTLYSCSTERIAIKASCINAERPIPGESDHFYGVARVSDDLSRFLAATGDADPMVVQAGVWALTDNYSGHDVQRKLFARDQFGNTRQAVSDAHIAEARRALNRLGIRNRL